MSRNEKTSTVGDATIEAELPFIDISDWCAQENVTPIFRKSQEEHTSILSGFFGKNQEKDNSILLDYLGIGAKNALTAGRLAEMLGTSRRNVSREIERLRRAGVPVCASGAAGEAGYYLPADLGELQDYCRRLRGRVKNVCRTMAALEETRDTLSGQTRVEGF